MNEVRTDRREPPRWQQPEGHDPDRVSLIRFGLIVAMALLLASLAPPGLVAASFSSLAFLAAILSALFAALGRESPLEPRLTRWDESAALLLLSMIGGAFVDPMEVEEAARAIGARS